MNRFMLFALYVLLGAAAFRLTTLELPGTTQVTPQSMAISPPLDGNLHLLGVIKGPQGLRFVTVDLQAGFVSATVLGSPPYKASLNLDTAYVMYRGSVPIKPGPCLHEGTGAISGDHSSFYYCAPDGTGKGFVWVQFTGGRTTWP